MAPRLHRACHAKISCLPARLSRARRAISRDCLPRKSTGTSEHDLSLFLVRLYRDPSIDAQKGGPCESVAKSSATIRMSRAHFRSCVAIPHAADQRLARCPGCPSRAVKIRLPAKADRDLSGLTWRPRANGEFPSEG